MALVYQMFTTSCELEESSLTLSLAELIYTYNFIVENFAKVCLLKEPEVSNDPLRLIVQELGQTTIEIKLSNEILNACINLRINCKLLVSNKDFVKCGDCHAPITKNLIASHKRFEEAFVGKAWSCQSKGCKGQKAHRKEQNNYWCLNCKVTMAIQNYPHDLLYKRFSCK